MRHPRLHIPAPLKKGAIIRLDADTTRRLTRVLRLRPGAALTVFNGDGGEYLAELVTVANDGAEVSVGSYNDREVESPLVLTLVQGISRGERMDYTIQKAVELGVARIVPVMTERCVVSLKGERGEKRMQHWQSVAISACEQCTRNRVPVIDEPLTYPAWLDRRHAASLKLLLDPLAATGPSALPKPDGEVVLLVGPEGGLSEAEIDAARRQGYRGLRLGPRVLRTESAAPAAISVLQTLWGDLG